MIYCSPRICSQCEVINFLLWILLVSTFKCLEKIISYLIWCYHIAKIVQSGIVWSRISVLFIQVKLWEGNLSSSLYEETSKGLTSFVNNLWNNFQNNYHYLLKYVFLPSSELKINLFPMKSTTVGANYIIQSFRKL